MQHLHLSSSIDDLYGVTILYTNPVTNGYKPAKNRFENREKAKLFMQERDIVLLKEAIKRYHASQWHLINFIAHGNRKLVDQMRQPLININHLVLFIDLQKPVLECCQKIDLIWNEVKRCKPIKEDTNRFVAWLGVHDYIEQFLTKYNPEGVYYEI